MMPKSKRQAYLPGSGEFLESDACMLLSGERPSLSPTHKDENTSCFTTAVRSGDSLPTIHL